MAQPSKRLRAVMDDDELATSRLKKSKVVSSRQKQVKPKK